MLGVNIEDGSGTSSKVKVTKQGQLVVGELFFNDVSSQTLDVINTAYNFAVGKSGQNFIVTGVLIYANKNVGVGDATLDIYEAADATSTTIDKTILTLEVPQKVYVPFLDNLNLKITEGKFLNAKTDDDDIFLTIFGYYAPVD